MSLSKLDVINRALMLIKEDCLTSLDRSNPVGLKACLAYDAAVKEVAEEHQWNALTKRVCLPRCEDPHHAWDRAYQLPEDKALLTNVREWCAARFREDEYSIECGKILVMSSCVEDLEEEEGLPITYVSNSKEPCEWGALFTKAVVYEMAASLAKPLDASDQIAGMMEEKAAQALDKAKSADAKEQGRGHGNYLNQMMASSPLLASRYRRGGGFGRGRNRGASGTSSNE